MKRGPAHIQEPLLCTLSYARGPSLAQLTQSMIQVTNQLPLQFCLWEKFLMEIEEQWVSVPFSMSDPSLAENKVWSFFWGSWKFYKTVYLTSEIFWSHLGGLTDFTIPLLHQKKQCVIMACSAPWGEWCCPWGKLQWNYQLNSNDRDRQDH